MGGRPSQIISPSYSLSLISLIIFYFLFISTCFHVFFIQFFNDEKHQVNKYLSSIYSVLGNVIGYIQTYTF